MGGHGHTRAALEPLTTRGTASSDEGESPSSRGDRNSRSGGGTHRTTSDKSGG